MKQVVTTVAARNLGYNESKELQMDVILAFMSDKDVFAYHLHGQILFDSLASKVPPNKESKCFLGSQAAKDSLLRFLRSFGVNWRSTPQPKQ